MPPNSDAAYLYFSSKGRGRCESPVGKIPNRKQQKVRVGGCPSSGHVMHEIMHKLGMKSPDNFILLNI